jgi:hypothetical protein
VVADEVTPDGEPETGIEARWFRQQPEPDLRGLDDWIAEAAFRAREQGTLSHMDAERYLDPWRFDEGSVALETLTRLLREQEQGTPR